MLRNSEQPANSTAWSIVDAYWQSLTNRQYQLQAEIPALRIVGYRHSVDDLLAKPGTTLKQISKKRQENDQYTNDETRFLLIYAYRAYQLTGCRETVLAHVRA